MDYLFSNNYICHFTMLRSDIIKRLKLRKEFDGAQDYDLFLRACSETALQLPQASNQIVHIEKVLYHWRCHQQSTAANPASKSYAYDAGRRALQDLADRYKMNAEAVELQHVGFYRLNYRQDIFLSREDIGCVGGRLIDSKSHRLCGGMYRKDGSLVYEGLHQGFSGGLQHRAVLQQDAFAVDIRCISVRDDMIPVFESITGVKYRDTYSGPAASAGVQKGAADTDAGALEEWSSFSGEEITAMSLSFSEQVRKRGLRVLWDPQAVIYVTNNS